MTRGSSSCPAGPSTVGVAVLDHTHLVLDTESLSLREAPLPPGCESRRRASRFRDNREEGPRVRRPTARGVSYGHSGFFPGYVTEMMYFPESKIAIAVPVNTSAPRVTIKPLTGFIVDLAELVEGTRQ